MPKTPPADTDLTASWTLPYAARLGSSVRSQGLYMQVRTQLPMAIRKSLTVSGGELALRMPAASAREFAAASAIVSKALVGIERRPVIPREIEDILDISSTERRRWLDDGRLPSAGTRTVKLRGRGTITFHVFDPDFVEEALNRDLVVDWREQDKEAAARRRREAAWRRKAATRSSDVAAGDDAAELIGWAEFKRTGLV